MSMDTDTNENRLFSDPELAQFYDLDNSWSTADLDYCFGLAQGARNVLDLGCGTGLLMSRLANQCMAVGVDPASAMLEIAGQQPNGDRVRWIEADARALQLDQRFDLIVLTGHAFQVFLSEQDQRAVLQTIAQHLTPQGQFIFDTRNPPAQAWATWTPELTKRTLAHPQLGNIEAWEDASCDQASGIVTYHTHYLSTSEQRHVSAVSKIRFTPKDQIATLLGEAGLVVETWLGDWSGNDYTTASPDIIPVGALHRS